MAQFLDSERLDLVQDLGRKYAEVARLEPPRDHKHEIYAILSVAATFNALEMAVFCQEIVSHFEDVHVASTCLTILSNRLLHMPTKE